MKKNLIIGLAVLVVVLVGRAAYFSFVKKSGPVAQQQTPKDETANWTIYTSPTFGYSIKYPATWTEKQGKVVEAGVSEDARNMSIEFYNGNTLMLRIGTDYQTKAGTDLLSMASFGSKTSDVVAYKIGSLDGYRRLLTDPDFGGLQYFTKDSKYIYQMYTFQSVELPEVVNMLKTFIAK